MRQSFAALLFAFTLTGPAMAQTAAPVAAPTDPYIWLEDVNGARSMDWVKTENARTLSVLEKDPRFEGLYGSALKIAEAKDRIPAPSFRGADIYNFWQDPEHVRGILRRTSLTSYKTATPVWTTVLDIDALAKAEGANWVYEGVNCLWPEDRYCLVSLSDGGEDAITVREFDLKTAAFVKGGFDLPKSKQNVTWEDKDTILVDRDWGPGTMTASGYAFVVKRAKRGEPLAKAVEIFRGTPQDVSVRAFRVHDTTGHAATFIDRGVSFFESEIYLVTPKGTVRVAVPLKANIHGLLDGRLLVEPKMDWTPTVGGRTYGAGSLVSVDLGALKADPAHLHPTLVYAPGPRETLAGVATTRSHMIVATYENVKGRIHVYTPVKGGAWSNHKLDLPDNASIGVAAADDRSERAFVSVTSFLEPTTLYLLDAGTGALSKSKTSPPRFDASRDVVEQHEATSTDGTKIPYFIVHPKGMKLDGSNPTIQYAYGGFENALTPNYNGALGKLWLENGGVYVLANIRGGGEFGPKWHEAGLKTKRQIIYDDFASVARDLTARKITSPRRLGIQGGSNGGLLMGVQFTQHPELWNAVDIQVPLLDMLRFEKIAAGASWVGEYGTVSKPNEAAFLAKISPYNNLHADTAYPEPFIWTTTKDDRVGPVHARKFAARLMELGKPYLFYEVTEGGHGAGANLKERAKTSALEYVYFTRKLVD